MKLFLKSKRFDQVVFSSCDGMALNTVTSLMEDIGHYEIEEITEQEFEAALIEQSH